MTLLPPSHQPSRPRRRPAAHGRAPPSPRRRPPAAPPAPAVARGGPGVDRRGKVVARVDGVDITEGDLAIAAEDPALQLPQRARGAEARPARSATWSTSSSAPRPPRPPRSATTPDFARKLAYNRDKTLLDEYLEQEAKKAVTPEAARKLYDETVKSMPPEQEVRARHILVENEEDAKKADARVKGGEDFAKVAGELSKDPGSKAEAAISASSPRTAWSSPSPRPPSSSSPARSPIR